MEDVENFFNGRKDLNKLGRMQLAKAFGYLDSSQKGSISKEEYVSRCLEAEKDLANTVEACKANLSKFKGQLEILKVNPMNPSTFARASKQQSETSILNLSVVEIKGYFPSDLRTKMSLYILVKAGKQEVGTEPAMNTLDPVWNKEFSLTLAKDVEIVRFEVFDLVAGNSLQACSEFALRTIKDQLRHEMWINLRNPAGEQVPGRVHVLAQWIYSSLKQKLYKQTQGMILNERKLKDECMVKLSMLQEPYGLLRFYEQEVSEMPDSPKKSPLHVPFVSADEFAERKAEPFRPLRSFLVLDNMLWMLFIFLSIINNWSKIDFVNTTVSVLGLATNTLVVPDNIESIIRLNLFLLTFALIFDAFWVFSVGGIALEASNLLTWVSFCVKLGIFSRLKEKLLYTDILALVKKHRRDDEEAYLAEKI